MRSLSRSLTTALALLLLASCSSAPRTEADLGTYVWPSRNDPKITLSQILEWDTLRRNMGFLKRLVGYEYDVEPLMRPYAVDANGTTIAVTDIQYGMLYLIDAETYTLDVVRTLGGEPMHSPVDVAFAGRDLYVVDSGTGKLFVLDTRTMKEHLFDVQAERPTSVSVDMAAGLVFITDTGTNTVIVTDMAGNVRFRLEGSFNFPIDTAIDAAARELYVLDAMNFRVAVFGYDGTEKRSFGKVGTVPGSFSKPKSIALDDLGRVYVADADFDNFQIFDTTGRLLYLIGSNGSGPAQFYMPARMAFHGGRLYVSDIYNKRVKVFTVNK